MKKHLVATAVLAAMTSANIAQAADTAPDKQSLEKCYGIAKAGKNDCAAKDGSNACAGRAKKDGDANNWVYVPKGLCDKLVASVKS